MSRPSVPSFAGTRDDPVVFVANGLGYGGRLSFPSGDFDFDSDFGVCQRSPCAALLANTSRASRSSPCGGEGITAETEKHVGPADSRNGNRAQPVRVLRRLQEQRCPLT